MRFLFLLLKRRLRRKIIKPASIAPNTVSEKYGYLIIAKTSVVIKTIDEMISTFFITGFLFLKYMIDEYTIKIPSPSTISMPAPGR